MSTSRRQRQEDGVVDGRVTRRRQKDLIESRATSILLKIPGITASSMSWFYMLRVVPEDDEVYEDIVEYIKNGQEHGYGVKVKKILRVVRNRDKEFEHDGKQRWRFRMMLWHGTKLASIPSILQNGFQLPPPKQQMFGPGIYFADRISKSCNYCDGTTPGSVAYLLLCDVLLGNVYNAKQAHNELTEPPTGFQKEFDSVKCTGKYIPDRDSQRRLQDDRHKSGSIIPCGRTIKNRNYPEFAVDYNEFIIYNTTQIKIRYVVPVKFTKVKCSYS